jgi:hypothetical protein
MVTSKRWGGRRIVVLTSAFRLRCPCVLCASCVRYDGSQAWGIFPQK